MSSLKEGGIIAGLGFGVLLVIFSIFGVIGMICWPYTINSWLVFMGKPPCIVWWQGFLMGFAPVLGQISIPAMIMTWLLMLFLV